MADATFSASGLASGLDTNSIVEQLAKIEQIPMDRLRARQAAYTTQVSALGELAAKIDSFKGASAKLATDGGLGVKATTTNDAFTATPGTSAAAGQYDIEVTELATNARANSTGNTKAAAIKSGSLDLSVAGTNYTIAIAEGATLTSIALAIKQSGAAVTATVLNNGTQDYLSIVRKDSGHTVGANPAETAANKAAALVITLNQTGATGENLGFTETDPVNSKFKVNGLDFERSSNSVTDVVPGTTLALKKKNTGVETLLLQNDTTLTSTNLAGFVDSYNRLMKTISDNLRPSAKSDRQYSLAGDGALRSLQTNLQSILTSVVGGQGNVRTLADLGFKTDQQNGTVTIDSTKLQKALDTDPSAVNAMFATASTGISALVADVGHKYTNTFDGFLTTRKKGLGAQIKTMDRQLDSLQVRLDAYKQNLKNQFASMEKTISGLKFTGQYLNSQRG